jgi:hypothetical protein
VDKAYFIMGQISEILKHLIAILYLINYNVKVKNGIASHSNNSIPSPLLISLWFKEPQCFNATFSNISAISWRPVLVVKEAGVLGESTTDHGQATGKHYHLRL